MKTVNVNIDINVNNIRRTHVKINNHGEDRIGPRLRAYNNHCWIAGWSGIWPQVLFVLSCLASWSSSTRLIATNCGKAGGAFCQTWNG